MEVTNRGSNAGQTTCRVTDPADLFDLDVPTVVRLERMGEVSAGKLVASIQGAKGRPLSKVLTALGPSRTQCSARPSPSPSTGN